MKILFVASGSPATVFALAPLATAARNAGHDVFMGAVEDVVPYIASAGIPALSIAPSSIRRFSTMDRAGNPVKMPETPAEELDFAGHWFGRMAAGSMDALRGLAGNWRPDLVVGGSMSFAAALIATELGVPYVRQAWDTGDAWRTDPAASEELQPELHELGLDELPEPDLFIDICPPSLRPADAPPAQMMRWIPANGQRQLEPWMYTKGDRPRVLVTSGSRLVFAKKTGFLRGLVADMAALNVETVIATLDEVAAELRAELPEVRAGWVPLDVVVPTCDVVVHHAGGVTALTAMNAGVPQLIVPQGGNFVEAGQRISDFGAAITVDEHTPGAVEKACRALINDPSYAERARALCDEITALPLPAEVVGVMERLVALRTGGIRAKTTKFREGEQGMSESGPIRVVMAKPEEGGRGSAAPPMLVDAFTAAGIEVVQAGDDQSPAGLVATVVSEGVEVICISSLLGEHDALFGGVIDLLAEKDAGQVTVIGGGVIPTADITVLKERGVAEIFSSGTPPWAVAEWVRDHVRRSSGV